MTKEQFQNPNTDMMLVYYFFYDLRGGKSLSFEQFRYAFSIWLHRILGIGSLPQLQYWALGELNKHLSFPYRN